MTAVNERAPIVRDPMEMLFRPRSVALVGISADLTKLTGAPLRNLLKTGFPGRIYPVNPKYDEVGGIRCYRALDALPEAPDVALISLAAASVPAAIRQLGAMGTRAAVVLSSGFEETESGAALADDLRAAAAEYGMVVVGPNCEGLWSVGDRLVLTFGSAANRDVLHHAPVGIISQSGAVAGGIGRSLQDSGAGCTYFVSVGNESCVDALDLLSWMIEQDDVKLVLLFIEGLKHGHRLGPIARRARQRGIRLVALKSGNSRLGQEAVASHTGKVASPYAVYRDLFAQAGVIQVDSIAELIDAGEILGNCPDPVASGSPDGGVAVFSIPGGTRALTVDMCERLHVPIATFAAQTETELAAILPGFAHVQNPTDLTGQVLSHPAMFADALDVVARDPACEALIVQLANRGPQDIVIHHDRIAGVARGYGMPVIVSFLGDQLPVAQRIALIKAGIVPACDPAAAVRYLAWLYQARATPDDRPVAATVAAPAAIAGDWDGLAALLDTVGIGLPGGVVVRDDAGLAAAQALAYPLVVKALPDQAEHKTELGLVLLGIATPAALAAAVAQIRARLDDTAAPVLVQETASGIEVVLSVITDPDFGPILAIGSGGIGVELWRDIGYVALPATDDAIRAMIGRLKLAVLLAGFRGKPAADIDALVAAAQRLGAFALAAREQITEIEINPLFVRPAGEGVVAADILVRAADKTGA